MNVRAEECDILACGAQSYARSAYFLISALRSPLKTESMPMPKAMAGARGRRPLIVVDSIRGATGRPYCNPLTCWVQSILHPERMMLGTTGSPAGFLTTSPTPGSEPEKNTSTLSPRFTSATP